jgi:calcyclin binding protein
MDVLTNDLEEFQRLVSTTESSRAKKVLTNEIQRIQREIDGLKQQTDTANPSANNGASATNSTFGNTLLPTTKITTYAWDQSEKFLKLYVTVPGAAPGQESQIRFEVQPKSADFYANDITGKNYFFTVKGLLLAVTPEGSQFKVKKNEILLMLKKKDEGKSWPAVTELEFQEKEKNKPKMDDKMGDPNDGLMKMMKQMYETGDDDMKRNINKAWTEAQDKKKDGTGDGSMSMAGLPGFM